MKGIDILIPETHLCLRLQAGLDKRSQIFRPYPAGSGDEYSPNLALPHQLIGKSPADVEHFSNFHGVQQSFGEMNIFMSDDHLASSLTI